MTNNSNTKIIAFVGLAGSGKSSAIDYLTEKGYPKVYFGGVIYAAMNEAGIEIKEENEKEFRVSIREKEGQDFVVKRIVTEIRGLIGAGQKRIVADGLYSWDEYKIMKHEFPGELAVIAIVAPKHLRHHRISIRPDRPRTEAEASSRDWSEIEDLNKGGPIAIADHFIINDGDIEKLHQGLDAVLTEIDF